MMLGRDAVPVTEEETKIPEVIGEDVKPKTTGMYPDLEPPSD